MTVPGQVADVVNGLPGSRAWTSVAFEGLQKSEDHTSTDPEVIRSSLAPAPTSRLQAADPVFVTVRVRAIPPPTVVVSPAVAAATAMSESTQSALADGLGLGDVVAEPLADGAADADG